MLLENEITNKQNFNLFGLKAQRAAHCTREAGRRIYTRAHTATSLGLGGESRLQAKSACRPSSHRLI
jgi:hypothetical protein